MPSVDPGAGERPVYPISPKGRVAMNSPSRQRVGEASIGAASIQHGTYGYAPNAYGGPPPIPTGPGYYHPSMGPPPPHLPPHPISSSSSIDHSNVNPFYGQHQYSSHPQQYPPPGYGNAPGVYMHPPPPYGYSGPPSWMSYAEGGPPPHGYYPSQQQRMLQQSASEDKVLTQQQQSRGLTGSSDGKANSFPETASATVGKDATSTDTQQLPNRLQQQQQHHATSEDYDRLKTSTNVVELGVSEVKPIQTDFHFFVQEYSKKLMSIATAEVDQKLIGRSTSFIRKHRTFLIHSNVNCRLLRAWEDLPRSEREDYIRREEDDRQRFMEEDEVVSRHCFTLTARIRSPNKSKSPGPEEDEEIDGDNNNENSDSPTKSENPSRYSNDEDMEDGEGDEDDENDQVNMIVEHENHTKIVAAEVNNTIEAATTKEDDSNVANISTNNTSTAEGKRIHDDTLPSTISDGTDSHTKVDDGSPSKKNKAEEDSTITIKSSLPSSDNDNNNNNVEMDVKEEEEQQEQQVPTTEGGGNVEI